MRGKIDFAENRLDLSLAKVEKSCNYFDLSLVKVAKSCNHLDLSLEKVAKVAKVSHSFVVVAIISIYRSQFVLQTF